MCEGSPACWVTLSQELCHLEVGLPAQVKLLQVILENRGVAVDKSCPDCHLRGKPERLAHESFGPL